MSGSCFSENRFTRDLRRAPERSSPQATAVVNRLERRKAVGVVLKIARRVRISVALKTAIVAPECPVIQIQRVFDHAAARAGLA